MSNVKIKGNASGTGNLTIEAPNTNTDRTLVLPDTDGTLIDSTGAALSNGTGPCYVHQVRGGLETILGPTGPDVSHVGQVGTVTNSPFRFVTENTERMRISDRRNLINATSGTIMHEWTYTDANEGAEINHPVFMFDGTTHFSAADGRVSNVYAEIVVVTTGTGTNNMYCKYAYHNNSDNNQAALIHIRGNSGSSSNRPYMVLSGQVPQWKMNHSTSYLVRINVKMYTREM